MLYRVSLKVLAVMAWTIAITAFVCYSYEGFTFRTCGLIGSAAFAVALVIFVMSDHRNKIKNAATAPSSLFSNEPEPSPVPLHAVTHADDNYVVMWYKGQPFDFVHNDPTAPSVV